MMTAIQHLLGNALEAGVPKGQLENFLRAGYCPLPWQLKFHSACRRADTPRAPNEVGAGGARGPGKSHAMLAQIALDDCQRFKGLKALMLRKIGKAGRQSFEDLRVKILKRTPHQYNRSTGEVTFPNGSRVVLGHFKDDRSFDAQIGLEYDLVGVEEATTLLSEKYKDIRTCQRTSKEGWRPRTYSNANPGGDGHAWYKARFIAPWRSGTETTTRFFPATYRDNPFLNEDYEAILAEYVGWKRKAWMDGDWDVMAGQFFTNFNLGTHCANPPSPPQSWWPIWLAMDTGYTHPTFVLLFTKDPLGNIYVLDEYFASGRLPKAHSNMFQQMLARHPWEKPDHFYVGGDAWSKDREGRLVADTYKKLGWRLTKANMDRISGAGLIVDLLGDEEAGIPATLFISPRCVKLLETLPRLAHDPHRVEDVKKCDVDSEGLGGDDAYDTLRYGLMSKPKTLKAGTLKIPW